MYPRCCSITAKLPEWPDGAAQASNSSCSCEALGDLRGHRTRCLLARLSRDQAKCSVRVAAPSRACQAAGPDAAARANLTWHGKRFNRTKLRVSPAGQGRVTCCKRSDSCLQLMLQTHVNSCLLRGAGPRQACQGAVVLEHQKMAANAKKCVSHPRGARKKS
jgi:hypothetical protein